MLADKLRAASLSVKNPPTFVSSATGEVATSANLVISKPTGVTSGMLLVACMASGGAVSWSGDTGWTEVLDQSASPSIRIAYKVATGSEPASYTFISGNSSFNHSGIVCAFSSASYDTVGVVGVSEPIVTAPSITASQNSSVCLAFYACSSSGVTFATPTGFSLISKNPTSGFAPNFFLFQKQISSGATGDVTSDSGGTVGVRAGVLLSLSPT